jgi:hypothetical protein
MRRIFGYLLGTLVALVTLQPALAQELRPQLNALSPEVRGLVVTWLWRDCGAGTEDRLADGIRAIGPRLEPVFWEAYRLGPPASEMNRDRAAMAKRYAERQTWLRQSGEALFGREETERLLAVSEADYVAREAGNAEIGYKTAAILGLSLVGTRASAAALRGIAREAENPAREAATQALKTLQPVP